jgi:hypothetical protein
MTWTKVPSPFANTALTNLYINHVMRYVANYHHVRHSVNVSKCGTLNWSRRRQLRERSKRYYEWLLHGAPFKANSHIPCRSPALPRICRSESDLSRPRHRAAGERRRMCELASAVLSRHVGDLPALEKWQGRGRRTAWEWHGMCESGFIVPLSANAATVCSSGCRLHKRSRCLI